MNAQYFWLIIIGFVLYFSILDPNIMKAIGYVSKLSESKLKQLKWWLLNDPSNPIVRYFIWRRSMETAKRIRKALDKKTK
jgi:hypothetical protein